MTPQEVIKTFMAKLTNHGYAYSSSVGTQMLDAAVQASSRFSGIQNVIDSMKSDQIEAEREAVAEVLGSDYAGKTLSEVDSKILSADAKNYDTNNKGNAYLNQWNDSRTTVERLIKERKAYIFLEKYCGIQLEKKYWLTSSNGVTSWADNTTSNVDTGAITGSDANITLKAGDVVYGTTLTAANMKTFAQQDGISLSGDTLIIGTGTEKTERSIVPEIGNKYTATTSTAQKINTGSNDWIVVATSGNDTITTGGADSINAGAGNDKITVGADYASILTGAGNDTVEVSAEVTNVTIGDLNASDALTIKGTFAIGDATKVDDTWLVIKDKTGTREIRLGDFENAKSSKVNGTTLANWLSNSGFDINNLKTSSSSNVIEELPAEAVEVSESGGGRVEVDSDYKPKAIEESPSNTTTIQEIGSQSVSGTVNINLDDVTITSGSVTGGEISNEFPNVSSFTKNGLTITLLGVTNDTSGGTGKIQTKTLDELTDDQRTIIAGLFKWWAKECLKLNEESYGISFNSDTATVNEIGLYFYNSNGKGNTLASVWNTSSGGTTIGLKLNVNMHYYSGIAEDNMDGESTGTSTLLDRTLSHEFTHAVMGANINGFSNLPQFIVEGMAELTHGIDDERGHTIFSLATDASKLTSALNLKDTGTGTTNAYAGGYMFLRYFAKQAALQELVDYANPDSGESWEINKTTATYKVNGEVVATIKGLRSGLAVKGNTIDGITVKDGVITLSQQVVGTSTVTLSTSKDYTLALDDSLEDKKVIVSNKKWTVNNGTATLTADWTSGYTLSEDATTITYTAAKTNQTLATVTGLATTGVTASDFSTDSNVITLKGSMVGTSKISVKGDGYTLALAEDAPKPELILPYWEVKGTGATYKQDTSAGFTLASDGKSASYSNVKTATLATLSGIKAVTTDNAETIKAAISIDADNKITLKADALGTSKVSVKEKGYTLALANDVSQPTLQTPYWAVSGTNATYKQDTSAGFTLASDNRSASYSDVKTATLATVSGIKAVTTDNAEAIKAAISIDADKKITLKADALGTSKVSVKEKGYTLALANDVSQPTLQTPYWAVSGTSATYKQDTSAGFTMASDNRSASYSNVKTATLATVSGIKAVTTDNAETIKAAISIDADNKITLKAAAFGTSKVSVKEKGYTLALANDVSQPTLQTPYWAVSGTNATYKQDTSAGFTLASDNRSASYSNVKTATLATLSGIKAVTDDNAEAIKAAISIDADNKITLKAAALDTSKVSVKEKGYTLALANDVAKPTPQTAYLEVSGTTAYYKQNISAGFTLASDNKSASYSDVKTTTLATISGLKAATADNAAAIKAAISIDADNKKITLKADALGTSKVSVKGDYTLALVEDVKPKLQTPYWEIKGTTAYYKQDTSTGFTLSKDGKSASYSNVKTATLATISGLKKGLEVKDNAIDGITVTDNVITLDAKVLDTSNVKVTGGNYTLSIDDSLKSAVNKNRWLVNGTTASYDNVESGYFTLSSNNKTLAYKKEKVNKNLVTVKGLAKGAKVESTGYVTGIYGGNGYGTRVMLTGDENFSDKVEVKLSTGYTLNSQLTPSNATKTYWSVKSGKGSLVQEMSAGYTTTTKNGTTTLTYSPVKSVTVSTISGLNKNLTDIGGSLDGLTLDLENKKIKVDSRVLSNSKVSVTGDYTLELVTTGNNAVPTEPKETKVWSVSGTKATYKNIYASYFTRKNDKTFNYNKEKTISTIATISGLKKDAATDSFSLSGNVITLTQDALPDTPTAKTKISLSTTEPYTLKLANGVGRVGYDASSWEYSKGKAMFRAEVRTAGYSTSLDNKTVTYMPKATIKTFATLSGVKSKEGITLTDNIITLGDAALNQSKVTLTTDDGYTLAINHDEVDSPTITKTEWVKKNTTAQVKGALTAGYTVSDDAKTINYSKATTNKVLATIKGIKSDKVAFDAVSTTATTINLNNSQLGDTVTVSGGYTFNFASDYSNKTILGTSAAESIAVAGSGVSVTCGKGNDYVDFTGNGNTFVYTSGDGDDVIADFTANSDKIMVTKGTVSVTRDGNDAIVNVDNKGSITLKGRGGQNINIVDKDGKAIDYTVSSADLLDSDNFLASSAQLDSITDSSFNAYSLDDVDSTAQNLKTLTKQSNIITYGNKK